MIFLQAVQQGYSRVCVNRFSSALIFPIAIGCDVTVVATSTDQWSQKMKVLISALFSIESKVLVHWKCLLKLLMLLLQDLLAGLAPPKCHFDKSILECSGVWKNKGRTLIHNVTSYLFVYVCVCFLWISAGHCQSTELAIGQKVEESRE